MTEQRRRRAGRALEVKDVYTAMENSTVGGNGKGKPRQHMPIAATGQGIKMEWERAAEVYPTTIHLEMTDGTWVKYRIDIQQPGFVVAMDNIKNMKRGYPPEKK